MATLTHFKGKLTLDKDEVRKLAQEERLHVYDFPRPALTVDIVLTNGNEKALRVLLVRRVKTAKKFPGMWALPGGYMEIGETLHQAAVRELKEETDINYLNLKFEFMQDDPLRETSDRIISAVHSGLVYSDYVKAGDDVDDAMWCSVFSLPELAFDHFSIIKKLIGYATQGKKYYKVVSKQQGKLLSTAVSSLSNPIFATEYHEGIFVSSKYGPLFVFDSINNAMNHIFNTRELWECEIKDKVEEFELRNLNTILRENIEEFFTTKYIRSNYGKWPVPTGTVACKEVKLLRKVQ